MKLNFRKFFLLLLAMLSLTACNPPSSPPPPPSQAIPINLSQLKSGFIPVIFGSVNAYSTLFFDLTRTLPAGTVISLPNGLQTPNSSPLSSPPNFWNIYYNGLFVAISATTNNLGQIVNVGGGGGDPITVTSLTPMTLNADGTITITNMLATFPELTQESNILNNHLAYIINNSSGSFATAPFKNGSIPDSPGLVFANFVVPGESSTITGFSPNFAACNGVIPGAGGDPSAINTINDTQNNMFLVGVGTESGAICIFDFIQESWISLTGSAISNGYTVEDSISAIQFVNFNNNRYLYFKSGIKLWRATLGGNNQIIELVNLLNLALYANAPLISNPSSLFIDQFNNIYIGGLFLQGFPIPPGTPPGLLPTSLNVYVLRPGFTSWQTIPLGFNSGFVTTISLAVDGKTPVVGVVGGAFLNDLISMSSSGNLNESAIGKLGLTINAYYLTGINN